MLMCSFLNLKVSSQTGVGLGTREKAEAEKAQRNLSVKA